MVVTIHENKNEHKNEMKIPCTIKYMKYVLDIDTFFWDTLYCTKSTDQCEQQGTEFCPNQHWLIPIMLGVYLLLGNVLLLNLLIAIFR